MFLCLLKRKVLFFVALPFILHSILFYGCVSSASITASNAVWDIIKSILYSLPFLCIKRKRILAYLYLFFLYIPTWLNVLHIVVFRSELNSCSLIIAFNSNMREISEFFAHFMSFKVVAITAVFVVSSILFVRAAAAGEQKYPQLSKKICLPIFFIGYILFATGNENYNNPIDRLAIAFYEFKKEENEIRETLKCQKSYTKIESILPENKKQTYIVVIGESACRRHMSLYGYFRKTTPRFDSFKDELCVFNNIKSPYATTLMVLRSVLTFDRNFNNGDLVSFLNKAGFKTYWISNQFVVEDKDNILSVEARQTSGFFVFKNVQTRYGCRSNTCDGDLLEPLQKALDDPAEKKVIFIHLLGSHSKYSIRYPVEFNRFATNNMPRFIREVAEYDNSILYTDYVLGEVLSKLKCLPKEEIAGFVYFSDHGEDCDETPNSTHSHCENGIPACYEIPLVIWCSQSYENARLGFKKNLDYDKKYCTKDMIHTLLDFVGLRNEKIDLRKSLLSDK